MRDLPGQQLLGFAQTERKEDMTHLTGQERAEMLARIGLTEEQLAANRARQLARASELEHQADQIDNGYYHCHDDGLSQRRSSRRPPSAYSYGKAVRLCVSESGVSGSINSAKMDQPLFTTAPIGKATTRRTP